MTEQPEQSDTPDEGMTTIWVDGLPVDVPTADVEAGLAEVMDQVRTARAEMRLTGDEDFLNG